MPGNDEATIRLGHFLLLPSRISITESSSLAHSRFIKQSSRLREWNAKGVA